MDARLGNPGGSSTYQVHRFFLYIQKIKDFFGDMKIYKDGQGTHLVARMILHIVQLPEPK